MFCAHCGIELTDSDRFCSQCGAATGRGCVSPLRTEQLSRPVHDKKIAGVCAGFARYFGVDVTLIRVIWLVLTIWPLPLFGVISYIVAWIVMPKDAELLPAIPMQPANQTH